MKSSIHYREGLYKYQLVQDYTSFVSIFGWKIDTPYIKLNTEGKLTLKTGYAWNGPSGPTIDTKNFMRGSLVHDALYQLMRMGRLPRKSCRYSADCILRRMCIEDGMSKIRAWWIYKIREAFGGVASQVRNRKKVLSAP